MSQQPQWRNFINLSVENIAKMEHSTDPWLVSRLQKERRAQSSRPHLARKC